MKTGEVLKAIGNNEAERPKMSVGGAPDPRAQELQVIVRRKSRLAKQHVITRPSTQVVYRWKGRVIDYRFTG
jgi:hypothetical protein